jgi:transporter family protein
MEPLELLILSAALQAAGTVLQKQRVATRVPNVALGQLTRRPGAFFGPLLRDSLWLLGGLLGFAGAMAGLQALSVMDLSVVKAVGRLEALFVILAGVVFLGERLRSGETVGVLLLLAGALLLALRSGETSGGGATREAYLVLVAGVGGAIVLLALARRPRGERVRPELGVAAAAGVLFGTGDILTKGATEVVKAGAPGGGFSVVESASMGDLVRTPEFGLAIAAYVGGSILVQAAFSVGRVSVIGPVTAIGSLLLPIAFGLVVLQEDPTGDRLAGIAAIALGTAILGRTPRAAARAEPPQRNETSRVAATTTKQRSLLEAGSAGTTKKPGRSAW